MSDDNKWDAIECRAASIKPDTSSVRMSRPSVGSPRWHKYVNELEVENKRLNSPVLKSEWQEMEAKVEEYQGLVESVALRSLPTLLDESGVEWVQVPRWFVDALLEKQ